MNEIAELAAITQTKSVLYVEDDKDIRANVSELLANLFKKVTTAVDGLDGLARYKEESYDYLITDIKMPKMTGDIMLDEVLKINPNQEVVIMTAHEEDTHIKKFTDIGVKYILQKPIDYDVLLKTLQNLVK